MQTFADFGIELPSHASGDVKVQCPQCGGDRVKHKFDRPLSVNVDQGVWHCHHCGWSDRLRTQGYRMPTPTVPKRPIPAEPAMITGLALEFLRRRGIDPTMAAEKYRIAGNNRGITVPYLLGDNWVNTKHRMFRTERGETDFKAGHAMDEGQPLIMWNIDACVGQETIAITEGEWDAIVVNEAGVPAMSVPNGASKGSNRMDYLSSASDVIEQAKRVLICVDNDEAGAYLEAELVRRIGAEKCQRVTWKLGKDANDTLLQGGIEMVKQALDDATFYPIEGIIAPIELEDKLSMLYHEGTPRGFSTGMAAIDPLLTIIPGMVYLVTGAPGAGKSEWLDQVVVNTMYQYEWRWAIFSPEGDPREEHLSRMVEKVAFAPFFEGSVPRMTWEEAHAAVGFINQYVTFIDPEEPTLDAILEAGRIELLRRGINCLVIDPWNEILHENQGNISEYLSKYLREIRRWAARSGVAVFIVNHPHRLELDKETKEYPLVRHYDLNGGAMWANKVSGIISIWRSRTERERPVEVNIIKTKTRRIGRTGQARIEYDIVTGRFSSRAAVEGDTYDFLG